MSEFKIKKNFSFFIFQFTEPPEKILVKTETTSPSVILTKHCTVRLDRIPTLDRMNVGTIYLKPVNQQNNVIDNNTVNLSIDLDIFLFNIFFLIFISFSLELFLNFSF